MKYDMRKAIKARELKQHFKALPDDSDICFGPTLGNHIGSLTFYRTKWVGDNLINVQFNEDFEVTMDPWEEMNKPETADSGPRLSPPEEIA